MGLAKVLLGRSKDSGLAKCARVDSLGLARRRLAAKHETAHREDEVVADGPGAEEPSEAGLRRAALPNGLEPQIPTDQEDEAEVPFGHRNLTDSLRLARRRFHQRNSLDLHPTTPGTCQAQRSAWSNTISSRPTGGRSSNHHSSRHAGDENLDDVASPHVRFRRASDGEYLTRHRRKSIEGSIPNAFRAVQQKAERLFRRLTGVPEPSARPRSASHTRGHSPPSRQRSGGHRSSASSAWAHFVPRRRTSESGSGDDASPSRNSSAPGRDRRKRRSAPGELLFGDSGADGDGDGGSPPTTPPAARRPASAIFKDGASGGKSRNWLARLSRGLNAATAHTSPHQKQTPPPHQQLQHQQHQAPVITVHSSASPAPASLQHNDDVAAAPLAAQPVAASDVKPDISPVPLTVASLPPIPMPVLLPPLRGSGERRGFHASEGQRGAAAGDQAGHDGSLHASSGVDGSGVDGSAPTASETAGAVPASDTDAAVAAATELSLLSMSTADSCARAEADCSGLPGRMASAAAEPVPAS